MNLLAREFRRLRESTLLRNAGWMVFGQGLSVVFQGLYFILLGRLLGSTQYGIYAGAVATVAVLSQYAPLGSQYVFLRYVSSDPSKFAEYWGNIVTTTLTLGGIFVVLLVWVGPYVAHSYSHEILLFVAISDCLFMQLTASIGTIFQTFERMRVTAFVNLLINFARVLLAGSLLWAFHRASAQQWVAAAFVISGVATVTALVLVTQNFGRPRFSAPLLKERAGEGLVFALSNSTGNISDNIDKVMLGHYGMNMANGIYTMAYRAVDVCTICLVAIQSAALPRFFREGTEGIGSTRAYAVRIVKRTGPLGLLSSIVLWLLAPVIPHLVGKSFTDSVSALRWLCLIPLFRSFQWSAGDALSGAGYQKSRLANQTFVAALNFVENLYLIPHYGWRGAAWSSLATDATIGALNWIVLLRLQAKQRKSPRTSQELP
jgi:O-antigen/teichoic acid export membrane protein